MYAESIDKFAKVGAHKALAAQLSPLAFLIGAAQRQPACPRAFPVG